MQAVGQSKLILSMLFLIFIIPKSKADDQNNCSPHCINCYDEDYCEECESGYFVNYDEGYPIFCSPCDGTCKECDYMSDSDCTACFDEFYLDKGHCKRCPTDKCLTCTESGTHECTKCLEKYYLLENECKPCHSSCLECSGPSENQCTKCSEGYFDHIPDETQHFCVLCDPNCYICENKDKCSECKENFFKNAEGKCVKCHNSCHNCTGETNSDCIECKDGFYLNGLQCRECDPNCKTCKNARNECTSCRDGQYVNDQKNCANCDENCKICKGPGQCTTCNDGFLPDKNGICVTCGTNSHCKICKWRTETSIDCLECADDAYVDYMWSDNTVRCYQCPQTCASCEDKDFCTSCITGFYLYREKCSKCAEGCHTCKDSADFCLSCNTGYRLSQNKCIKCPEGCSECESDTKCTSCLTGYYLNNDICNKCDISCKDCTDGSNACQECAIGFVFDQTKRCVRCPGNCTMCDQTGCLDCDPEFFPLKDGSCAPCAEVCFECTGPTADDCYECDPGFYFDRKLRQCIACDPACKTCNGPRDTNCDECAKGYWHTERYDLELYEYVEICGPCEFACSECTDDDICTVCNDGFRLYDGISSPDCEACVKGCKRCDDAKDKCTECLEKFYVSSREGNYVNCSSCPSNCRSCRKESTGSLTCLDCIDGYYLENGRCIKCNSPCATCSSASICTSCIAGHLFDGIKSCDSLCHPDCFTCERTQTTCTSCHDGFYLVNNSCIKCTLEGCKKCIIGEHQSTCRECADGYYKDVYYDSCYPCNKACGTCDEMSNKNCLTCAVGYYTQSVSGTHLTCSPCTEAGANCLECHKDCDGSTGENCQLVCTRCIEGYSFVDNQCIKCHESCKTCDGPTENDCVTCTDKYFLNSDGKCTKCSEACENCEGNDNKCTSCKSHYYVKNGECVECDSSCLDCYGSSTNCTSCPENKFYYEGKCYDACNETGPGMGQNMNKECVKCNIYNCLAYDFLCQCQKCDKGYFIYTDPITEIEICLSCGVDNCLNCSGPGNDECLICQDGFYMNTNSLNGYVSCLPCTDNCLQCTSNNVCTECQKGYQIVDGKCQREGILPGQSCGGTIKCDFSNESVENPAPLVVESGKFHDIKVIDDGGAIKIVNYPIQMKNVLISKCETEKGGGGIFIKIDKKIEEKVVFEHLTLSQCKAKYGGGIYAFSDKEENEIKIISCKFEKCEAHKKPSESGNILFGGSALYMHVINGRVNGCSFINNVGNIIKVNNNFDDSLMHLMNSIESSFSIKNCIFESSKSLSSSSLYYIRGDQHEIQFKVKNCVFKGNLLNGAHFIDGMKLGNINDKLSKLRVEHCIFSDIKSALDSKKLGLIVNSFDNNSQKLDFRKSDNHTIKKIISVTIVTISCFIIVISIILVSQKNKVLQSSIDDEINTDFDQREL